VILGAGDVVVNRLLPALFARDVFDRAHIFHNGIVRDAPILRKKNDAIKLSRIDETWIDRISPNAPVIIATPPAPRLALLQQAMRSGHRVIVEKPLTTDPKELVQYRALIPDTQNLFCLSYYALEKALAWSWLHRSETAWAEQLVPIGTEKIEEIRNEFLHLGAPEHLEISICEPFGAAPVGATPYWFENTQHGVWYDLGVHAVMMASLVFDWDEVNELKAIQPARDQFTIDSQSGSTRLKLVFGKNYSIENRRRTLVATYRSGRIFCDLDEAVATIEASNRTFKIQLNHGSRKYHTLAEHINRFLAGRADRTANARWDLLDTQINAVSQLNKLEKQLH
jgi:putative ubiquitin-RnfH superfamily antitoxin RatB of RatAB toxin-antitoxin module